MNVLSKVGVSVVSSVVALSAVTPVAFAADVTVSGNGAHAHTKVKVMNTKKTKLSQTNVVSVSTMQGASSSTGGNKISNTTGGVGSIDTGNATSSNTATVVGPSNALFFTDSCGCDPDATVHVSGNGAGSHNGVTVKNYNKTSLAQYNEALVLTVQTSGATTGDNTVKNTTGSGSEVTTGNASSSNSTSVEVGGNVAGPAL